MAEALVLSLLPFCISALEHYGDAVTAISRFQQFSSEARNLIALLKVQRTIFRVANKRLLSRCVEQELLHQMMDDEQHLLWQDNEVDKSITRSLGDSAGAAAESVRMIGASLSQLELECLEYARVLEQQEMEQNSASLEWCRRSRKRIKFAFSGSRFRNSIDHVRNLTQDYQTLLRQTEAAGERLPSLEIPCEPPKEIEDFSLVGRAAKNLCEALGVACTKHSEHQAHFSLQKFQAKSKAQIRFNIAYRQYAVSTVACSHQPMWLVVESLLSGTIKTGVQGIETDINFSQTGKRPRDCGLSGQNRCEGMRQRRRVRFQSPKPKLSIPVPKKPVEIDVRQMSSSLDLFETCIQPPVLPNLCINSNLCNHLQSYLVSPRACSWSDCCVGVLEHTTDSKHLVYLDPQGGQLNTEASQSTLISLRDAFSQAGRKDRGDITYSAFERVRLARRLATAVLKYHATPLVGDTWSSNDISLRTTKTTNTSSNSGNLDDPYISVSVKSPDFLLSRISTFTNRTIIRNPILFGLGVILLELAFEATLQSLQRKEDFDITEISTEYRTALRVRHSASRLLGGVYAEVARKCIQCDFGRGDDLNEKGLQAGFYKDAVCKLEEVEELLRRCDLGP